MNGLIRAITGLFLRLIFSIFKLLGLPAFAIIAIHYLTGAFQSMPEIENGAPSTHLFRESIAAKEFSLSPISGPLTPAQDAADSSLTRALAKFWQRVKRAREELRAKVQEQQKRRSKQTNNTPSPLHLGKSKRSDETRAEEQQAVFAAFVPKGEPFERGQASFYGRRWNGRKTASGEIYNDALYTAAHKTLPFGLFVRVVRKDNGRQVVVRINDRGPFKKGRIIDLSTAGARRLGMIEEGVVEVELYPADVADFLQQFESDGRR